MKTQIKLEKKGYKITYNISLQDDEQKITSVSAKKDKKTITAKNITQLSKLV